MTRAGIGSVPVSGKKVTHAVVPGKQGLRHEQTVTEAGVSNDPGINRKCPSE